MAEAPAKRITWRCPCGCYEVTGNAPTSWNTQTQVWEVSGTYDDMFCNECGYDGNHFEEVEIDENDQPIPDEDYETPPIEEPVNQIGKNIFGD